MPNLELGTGQQTLVEVPDAYRAHQKLSKDELIWCKWKLQNVLAQKDKGAFAAQCEECPYYVEYWPPADYARIAAAILGQLEPVLGDWC